MDLMWTGPQARRYVPLPNGVLALTCAYGQIYACAVFSLQASGQAGLEIPGAVGKGIQTAAKAPQCIDGDYVACAYLGARGAEAVGLDLPGLSAIDVAADAHLRFVSIHPFVDGNGRVGRLLMNLVLMRGGYPPALVRKEDREEYIGAIEAAPW